MTRFTIHSLSVFVTLALVCLSDARAQTNRGTQTSKGAQGSKGAPNGKGAQGGANGMRRNSENLETPVDEDRSRTPAQPTKGSRAKSKPVPREDIETPIDENAPLLKRRVPENPSDAATNATALMPDPFPEMTEEESRQIDALLAKWEKESGKIERYRCDFERWEFDPVFGPPNPDQEKVYSTGRIVYFAPDKGMFKVGTTKTYVQPRKKGEKIHWEENKDPGEKWICDGKSIFEFDGKNSKVIERPLPPNVQGKDIVDGPLPFLFGAKADKIKARYYLRNVTPAKTKGEFWLEAWPKYRGDAMNFKKVTVIISQSNFLPSAMEVCDPSWNPTERNIRTSFQFNNAERNWNETIDKIKKLGFDEMDTRAPLGWKKEVETFQEHPADQQRQPDPQRPRGEPPLQQAEKKSKDPGAMKKKGALK